MKESKVAGFTNVSFKASFDGGKLVELQIDVNAARTILTADEVAELHQWLNESVLELHAVQPLPTPQPQYPGPLPPFVVTAGDTNPLANDYFTGPLIKLEDRATDKVGGPKHISDAESVENRIPVSKALERDGFKMESKPITPVTVTFKGGK